MALLSLRTEIELIEKFIRYIVTAVYYVYSAQKWSE